MFARLECRKINRLLWDYAAMALCEPDMERVETHLSACRACAMRAEEYASVVGIVRRGRFNRMPESQETWHGLRATLEMERKPARTRRDPFRFLAPALGSLAVAALLALFLAPEISKESVSNRFPKTVDDRNPGKPKAPYTAPNNHISDTVALNPGSDSGEPVKTKETGSGGVSLVSTPSSASEKTQTKSQISPEAYQTSPKPASRFADSVSGDQADRAIDTLPKRDYVLTPVGMGDPQSGNSPHFVMGAIPRSEGGITTASYTKAVEEAPVW